MRSSTTLGRALSKMTVDTHKQMRSREDQNKYYKLTEREQQFQYGISGNVGLVPVETAIKIRFDHFFLYEYGYLRDSQLLEPQTHFGFTKLSAPAGTVPYAHVASWIQDEDRNYVGAHVVVGVHNPTIAASGAANVTATAFSGTLHASFQGFGAPIDPFDGEN